MANGVLNVIASCNIQNLMVISIVWYVTIKDGRIRMRLLIIFLVVWTLFTGYVIWQDVNLTTTQAGYDRQLEVIEVEVTAYSPSKA